MDRRRRGWYAIASPPPTAAQVAREWHKLITSYPSRLTGAFLIEHVYDSRAIINDFHISANSYFEGAP